MKQACMLSIEMLFFSQTVQQVAGEEEPKNEPNEGRKLRVVMAVWQVGSTARNFLASL